MDTVRHASERGCNKLKEWFKAGLADWDISRDAPYFGFEIPDAPGKFFYVWLDAPIGYMASFQNFCEKNNINFDEFWSKDSEAELIHFIGKDILYFHALFWPATLEFSNYRLPSKIFAHGFLTVNGEKMSKSRGTFITARSYLDTVKDPDLLRYYFFSKLNDSMEDLDLNLDDFISKINSDLVGKFINIPSRTSGFIKKYFDYNLMTKDQFTSDETKALLDVILSNVDEVKKYYHDREFSKLNRLIMNLIESVNEFINNKEPWVLAKQDNQDQPNSDLHEICSAALQSFRVISLYLSPVLPVLTHKISAFFDEEFTDFDQINNSVKKINQYEHMLKRVERESVDQMIELNTVKD